MQEMMETQAEAVFTEMRGQKGHEVVDGKRKLRKKGGSPRQFQVSNLNGDGQADPAPQDREHQDLGCAGPSGHPRGCDLAM